MKILQYLLPLFILGGLTSSALFAQPTLTAANTNSKIGDTLTLYRVDYVAPGDSGANVTWDFSNLVLTSSNYLEFVAPSNTPFAASFPNSNLAADYGNGNYEFFNATSSVWERSGARASGVTVSYSNPQTILEYPVTYMSSYSDNFSATFTSGVAYNRSGTLQATADGYGTLILPSGTFQNALRVKYEEDYQDVYNPGSGPQTIDYETEIYFWHVPGISYPVVSMTSFTNAGSTITYGNYRIIQGTTAISEAMRLEKSVSVYPNPTTSNVNIAFELITPAEVQIQVTDIAGKMISSNDLGKLAAGGHVHNINQTELAKGFYLVHIKHSNEVAVRKLQVM